MKKLLKICLGTWENASRDKRELSAAESAGFDVYVLCKGEPQDKMKPKIIDGFQAYACGTRPVSHFPVAVNRVISALQWIHYIRKFHADVLSCHDLVALQMGYVSNLFKGKKKSVLIYDSHEFEMGRNTGGRRGRIASWYIKHAESFLMKRCALSIIPCETAAEKTQQIHKLKEKPLVIRNVCQYWNIEKDEIKRRRKEFEKAMPALENRFLLMYHGGLMTGRGIEQLLELVSVNKNVCAVILGNGSESYCDALKEQAENLGINDRVLFHPAVPHEILWKYVGAADVGMVTVQNVCQSYYYMLPNKFFENIQSLTPIICSDFPEVSRITNGYGIGLTCDPADIADTNRQVERMRTDTEFYKLCKENLKRAKEEICWEREKVKLEKAYGKIMENLKK